MPFKISSTTDQVVGYLREQLLANRWAQELPGTPALSAELGVDRKILIAALNLLEEEGLLKSQGTGRSRRITLEQSKISNALKISIIPYDAEVQEIPYILEMIHQLKELGHQASMGNKTLLGMNMDTKKIGHLVQNEPADLWIPLGASASVLRWFLQQDIPVFAFFGVRHELKIGSVGPDKSIALKEAVRKLIAMGHRRICYLVREERRKPKPGNLESIFLKELVSHGIVVSSYNMPDWENCTTGFNAALDKLFILTPPTALIFDEAQFLIAAIHRLAQSDITAPRDVSMMCMDHHPCLDWCLPHVSHVSWEPKVLVEKTVEWVEQFSRGKDIREHIYFPAVFIEGETIGPVKLP